ncbi:hypothetical protein QJS66_11675 [Kocuria rhizophila]|nr:hypothetical protein QJS66_11675 [Kocuria rhizophila]
MTLPNYRQGGCAARWQAVAVRPGVVLQTRCSPRSPWNSGRTRSCKTAENFGYGQELSIPPAG